MRPAIRTLLAGFAAALLLGAPSARAGDTYVALKGGVLAPTAKDGISAAGGAVTGQFPTSGDVEVALGATFGIIGAQISTGYMWSSQTVTNLGATGTAKASMIPLTVVGQLRLPIFFIQPYLEAGIGGLLNFATTSEAFVSTATTKASFMVVGGAGVDFILGPVLLGAEARYNYITEQTFDWGSMKLSGVTITANVGYVF
ncbi:MAG: hypothetical protein WCK73_04715 [Deltaproteobacteria bacterium]